MKKENVQTAKYLILINIEQLFIQIYIRTDDHSV